MGRTGGVSDETNRRDIHTAHGIQTGRFTTTLVSREEDHHTITASMDALYVVALGASGCVNVIGRLMVRSEWSETQSERIVEVVNSLHKQGYRGEELFKKSREIVIPASSASNIIALAKESDDAAFVESVMKKAIKRESPIRDVAIKRYCDRKCPQDIARMISYITGADVQFCRKRVIWCEEILEEEMYYAMKHAMEKEILQNAA